MNSAARLAGAKVCLKEPVVEGGGRVGLQADTVNPQSSFRELVPLSYSGLTYMEAHYTGLTCTVDRCTHNCMTQPEET